MHSADWTDFLMLPYDWANYLLIFTYVAEMPIDRAK